jgi:hypothetical protein
MAGRIILGIANPSLDANGVVATGSTLTFWANKTTTLQAIYSAADLLTPLANPLTCDAAGRFPEIWGLDFSTYSVKWTVPGETPIVYDDIYVASSSSAVPSTRQKFTAGTAQTYTTPANVRQLRIRMWGGGGGGAGTGTSGDTTASNGVASVFNAITANGGGRGLNNGIGGAGGTAGAGTASIRFAGAPGGMGGTSINAAANAQPYGGQGGGQGGGVGSPTFGAGGAGLANTGGGGGGAGAAVQTFADLASWQIAGGGGGGEYVEIIINSPAATYTYTVGAGGAAGNSGTSGFVGGGGGSGYIIVDEFY